MTGADEVVAPSALRGAPSPTARPGMDRDEPGGRPSGVVTFLFTDIEGSTGLWTREPDAMRESLERHDTIVRTCVTAGRGHVFATSGDSFAVAFHRPQEAVTTAIALQTALQHTVWPTSAPIRVRIGLHLGVADERADNYFGASVSLAARVEQCAHGGQIVVTEAVAAHLDRVELLPLGGHRLRGFDEPIHLFAVVVPGLEADHPPLRTERVGATSLPSRNTSLVGREDAVVEIRQLLRSYRLVTLTGPGGIGKTSLALEVAARESAASPDAVFFVELSAVPKGGDVTPPFFQALGIRPDGSGRPAQQLAHALAGRSALLCVDNCEHVLDQVAEMVGVLAPCLQLRAVATSREPLSVPGERVWRVPTLPIRPTAVQLFESRASDIDSSFRVVPAAEPTIAEICQRVDGLPLAIELAASRVRTLSLTDIRDGLDHRFRLLGSNTRGSPARHRTLEAVISWSYALLDAGHQSVLRQLGIFEHSFDLSDVIGVTGLDEFEAIETLDALVSKSLVDAFRPPRLAYSHELGPVRYRLLESLWSFARDRLVEAGERDAALDRYLDHLVAIEGSPADLRMTQAGSRLRIRSFANLRSAANWAFDRGRVADLTRLTLGRAVAIVENGAAHEGLAWLAGRDHLSRADRLWALNGCAYLAMALGEPEQARAFLRECFELADGEPFDAMPNAYGFAAMIDLQTDNAAALDLMDRAIAFAPATPSGAQQLPFLHHVRGLVHLHAREWEAAVKDSLVAIELTPPGSVLHGVGFHGLGFVTHLVALTVLERSAAFDAAFEQGFGTGEDDSLVADIGWNRRLLGFLRSEASDDETAVVAKLAEEALAPHGGLIGQRCADLLAVVVWRRGGHSFASSDELVAAAVSTSAFGALATESLGRSRGWTDEEWPERLARLSRAAQSAESRATAIQQAWRLREPAASGGR